MKAFFILMLTVIGAVVWRAPQEDIRELKVKDWLPRSSMVTRATRVEKPAFPVIDIHNHLGSGRQYLTTERIKRYLDEMDAAGIRTVVNLDGRSEQTLKDTIELLDRAHPGRFITFANVDFSGVDESSWSEREVRRLEEGFRAGARGVKFYKSFGLGVRYKDGKLMRIDDPKMEPIWEVCARFKRPVIIHTADPAAFWKPLDRFSERWHELNRHPEWLFADSARYPPREDLLAQLYGVIAKNPKTTFISTHFGNNAEDLGFVAEKLASLPNLYVDIDARISELGRQPYTTRRLFLKYPDRIMFGTDTTPNREAFRIYFRFLETDDEYFDPALSHHQQGFWNIYGIFLPKDVLAKVYYKNAERLLGVKVVSK